MGESEGVMVRRGRSENQASRARGLKLCGINASAEYALAL